MVFSENLMDLRKKAGWSQEELGFRLGVSRQTVSKWESGETTPEMQKLVGISELFMISMDELAGRKERQVEGKGKSRHGYEYKSGKSWRGLPLVHVNLGFGFKVARGIIAVGNLAVGVVSIGGVSAGLFTVGGLSFGGLVLAGLAAGLFSFGGVAFGLVAVGGVALGHLAVGGVAVGNYAVGGMAAAQKIAVGGHAEGLIAVGQTVAGKVEFPVKKGVWDLDSESFAAAIREHIPGISKILYRFFTGMVR